jgi:hypothetical protein
MIHRQGNDKPLLPETGKPLPRKNKKSTDSEEQRQNWQKSLHRLIIEVGEPEETPESSSAEYRNLRTPHFSANILENNGSRRTENSRCERDTGANEDICGNPAPLTD